MNEKEIERAAYTSAHLIVMANTAPIGLACPGARRSYAVDTIAGIIKEVFELYLARPGVWTDRSARRIESLPEDARKRPAGIVLQLPLRAS